MTAARNPTEERAKRGSVLSSMAGALFGLVWRVLAVVAGSLLAAAVQFALSLHLLRARIQRMLATKPSLAAIQRAVLLNEVRLQMLLRLTPVNPATVSYALRVTGVRFGWFMLACLALTPHLIVEVWFGYAGKHIAQLAGGSTRTTHLQVLAIIVMILVARMARKALLETEVKGGKALAGSGTP